MGLTSVMMSSPNSSSASLNAVLLTCTIATTSGSGDATANENLSFESETARRRGKRGGKNLKPKIHCKNAMKMTGAMHPPPGFETPPPGFETPPPGFESEANTANTTAVAADGLKKRQNLNLSKGPHLAKGPGWCVPFSARSGEPIVLLPEPTSSSHNADVTLTARVAQARKCSELMMGEQKGKQKSKLQQDKAFKNAETSPVTQPREVLTKKATKSPKSDPVITFQKTSRYAHEAASRSKRNSEGHHNAEPGVEQPNAEAKLTTSNNFRTQKSPLGYNWLKGAAVYGLAMVAASAVAVSAMEWQ